MITIFLDKNDKPLYEQIYEAIKDEIINNDLNYMDKLPSKRKLSSHLHVSVNTIDTAYSQLVAEGYIESIPKKGYFVCQIDEYRHDSINNSSLTNSIQFSNKNIINFQPKSIIDFSPSDIDYSIFPYNTFRKIFKSIFHEDNKSLLLKADVQGDMTLRQALCRFLYSSRGVVCHESQIIIGTGTDALLQTLSIILGRDKTIAFENPVYLKAYNMFKSMGNHVIPIDIDDKGIRLDLLKKLTNSAIYVTPSHHFPLGISMPIDRRIKLLNYANSLNDTYIIEDDYDSEFRYNEKPLPSLKSIDKSGKVIYVGTFSRSIAPSIRISYMILPKTLLVDYLEKYRDLSSSVSSLEQKMTADFINSGAYEKHINKMRKIYKDKRAYLIKAFSKYDSIKIMGENAGHHLLLSVNTNLTEDEMCRNALNNGVKVYSISPYFVNGVTKGYESTVLLGYGSLTYAQIDDGVHYLVKAWDILHNTELQ